MTVLGFLLLIVMTAAAFVAASGFVRRFLPGRLSERIAVSMATVLGLAVAEVMLFGVLWNLYYFAVIVIFELVVIGAGCWVFRKEIREEWLELKGAFSEMRSERPGFVPVVALVAAGSVWVASLLFTFEAPFPGVDAVAYHLPIAVLVNHEHGLEKFETRSGHVNEFPKNGQFFFARTILMANDERPLHFLQWFAGILAAITIFAWLRNWGVSYQVAGTVAPLFLLVPAVVTQEMVLWGTIDLVFHSLVILTWCLISQIPKDPGEAFRRGLFILFIGALTIGSKGQGLTLAGAPLAIMSVVLLIRRFRLQWYFSFAAWGTAILLFFASYQYVQNYFWHQNPFSPIRLKVGETVIFDGLYHSVHTLVGTREAADTGKNKKALFKSWKVLWTKDWVPIHSRLGGWGPAWLFVILPGWVLGIGWLLWKKRWYEAVIGVALLYLLLEVPGSWWARFSLHAFAAGLVFLGVFISGMPKAAVKIGILLVAILASLVSGGEAYLTLRKYNIPNDLSSPGPYLQALDTFRASEEWETEEHRKLYHWVRDEMPDGANFVYFHPWYWGIYQYYFYKHNYSGRVYGLGDVESPEYLYETLVEREADYFMIQDEIEKEEVVLPLPEAEWAKIYGPPVFQVGIYKVYKFDPSRYAKPDDL